MTPQKTALARNAANAITGSRILLSLILLFLRPLSPGFTAVYLLAGLTDMVDGTIARKTKTASAFGAKLDAVADLCFFMAAAYKVLPVIRLPFWALAWGAAIAAVKAGNFALCRGIPAAHTFANKAAGLSLFLLPLIRSDCAAFPVCAIATFAALQERRGIRNRR